MKEVTRRGLEDFVSNHLGFFGLDISRISSIFIAKMMQMQASRVIDTHQMLDAVKALEGIGRETSTKEPGTFKKAPLTGINESSFYRRFISC